MHHVVWAVSIFFFRAECYRAGVFEALEDCGINDSFHCSYPFFVFLNMSAFF